MTLTGLSAVSLVWLAEIWSCEWSPAGQNWGWETEAPPDSHRCCPDIHWWTSVWKEKKILGKGDALGAWLETREHGVQLLTCHKWARGLGRPHTPTEAHEYIPLSGEASSGVANMDPAKNKMRQKSSSGAWIIRSFSQNVACYPTLYTNIMHTQFSFTIQSTHVNSSHYEVN